jgi:hypothetical protein
VSAHRVSPLERHCRLLLRAYPAGYRRERGEEIIGTLLEADSGDRTRPPLRDSRALIAGGLRVRAAQNRRLGAAASLRLAALLGVAVWLGTISASFLAFAFPYWTEPGAAVFPPSPIRYPVLAGLLTLAAVAAAWLACRVVVVAAALAAAAAWVPALVHGWRSPETLEALLLVAALAALAALVTGSERPPRAWLCWVGVAACLLQDTGGGRLLTVRPELEVAAVIAAVLWMVIDTRPAMAVAIAAGLSGAASYGYSLVAHPQATLWRAPFLARLALLAGLAMLAAWRLRRQAAL